MKSIVWNLLVKSIICFNNKNSSFIRKLINGDRVNSNKKYTNEQASVFSTLAFIGGGDGTRDCIVFCLLDRMGIFQ